MIRAHFGLVKDPFSTENLVLLPQQVEVLDTLRVHCQQGGLCVIVGEPGTGKSVIKRALCQHDPKRIMTPVVNRNLHTYHSTLRILCEAFHNRKSGRRLPVRKAPHRRSQAPRQRRQDARSHHRRRPFDGRLSAAPHPSAFRGLSQEPLPRPRRTAGALEQAHPDRQRRHQEPRDLLGLDAEAGPRQCRQLHPRRTRQGRVAHATFTDDALSLIVRSSEGVLRRARNLCLGAMLEAVRDRIRTVDLKQANRVLLQPHWRRAADHQELG